MAGLLDYLKVAEGYKGTYHSDPSTKSQQTNIGFGVRATKEVRELRDLFLANGVDEKVIDDMLLRKSIQEHKERAKEKFNEGIRRHHTTGAPTQIEFDKQPPIVQELLTELEFNGGLGGWPELMRNAKNGDYQGVEAEMDLSVEKSTNKEGTKRRNRLRNKYFSEALMAEPELRLADAYGTVEQDTKKHSLWPDATMFGLPKNPIDYLFGSKEPSPQQPTPQQQQAGHMGFAMENIGNIDPQRMPPQQQMPLQQLNKQYPLATRQMLEDYHLSGLRADSPQQRLPTLQEAAETAQVQPALDPFPWLRETYDRRSKVGMYPEKKKFKSRSMYPQPKNF